MRHSERKGAEIALQEEIELAGITVLARQGLMQGDKPVPTHTSLNLLHCFTFPNQDPQGLAVERIAGFQLANGKGRRECWSVHVA